MLIGLASIGIIFWLFYYFFIKGNAWPIILVIIGVYGGKMLILEQFPNSSKTVMTFMEYEISWAAFIATILVILGVTILAEKFSNE